MVTACLPVKPAKQYDFGAGQVIHALEHVRELCPFSPHAEQVLRCFLTLTTLGSLKMFAQPARPSRGLLTFLALTALGSLKMFMQSARPTRGLFTFLALTALGSLKMFMQSARPTRGLLTFLALTTGSIAPSSAATRCSAGETVSWQVRLLWPEQLH